MDKFQLDSLTFEPLKHLLAIGSKIKSEDVLLSAYFVVNSEKNHQILLEITKEALIISCQKQTQKAQVYSLPFDQNPTYRLIRCKQDKSDENQWQLLIFFNDVKISLSPLKRASPDDWDDELRKHLNKVGFLQEFKPVRVLAKDAKVYHVRRSRDQRDFAVKAFSKRGEYDNPKPYQATINEIKLMRITSRQRPEHILSLYEVYQSENSIYLVMELCTGGTLADKIRLESELFREKQTKGIMKQILRGLTQLHSKNIAHRDIKPQNILVRNRGTFEIVIADMGLATLVDEENYLFSRCGTPGYVAPQIMEAHPEEKLFNASCDIFSLGSIFHYLLTGNQLFSAQSPEELLEKNKLFEIDLENERYEDIPKDAMILLKKMLQMNPYQRIGAETALNDPYFKEQECEQRPKSQMQTSIFLQEIKSQRNQNQELEDLGNSRDRRKEYRKTSHT